VENGPHYVSVIELYDEMFNDPQNSLVWLHAGKKHVGLLAQDSKRSVCFAIKEAPVVK
jgi:hypothetical protein